MTLDPSWNQTKDVPSSNHIEAVTADSSFLGDELVVFVSAHSESSEENISNVYICVTSVCSGFSKLKRRVANFNFQYHEKIHTTENVYRQLNNSFQSTGRYYGFAPLLRSTCRNTPALICSHSATRTSVRSSIDVRQWGLVHSLCSQFIPEVLDGSRSGASQPFIYGPRFIMQKQGRIFLKLIPEQYKYCMI